MASRNRVVEELLRALVREWGHTTVLKCLTEIQDGSAAGVGSHKRAETRRPLTDTSGILRARVDRPSAVEQVTKMEIPDEKRPALLDLASRFETRRFLPSTGDIRNFLETNHEAVGTLHGREAAVPKVFRVLVSLPQERLHEIVQGGAYSGPTQLGPLSEAIRATRTAIRSNREPTSRMDEERTISDLPDKLKPTGD
jgi:hypothetical protein